MSCHEPDEHEQGPSPNLAIPSLKATLMYDPAALASPHPATSPAARTVVLTPSARAGTGTVAMARTPSEVPVPPVVASQPPPASTRRAGGRAPMRAGAVAAGVGLLALAAAALAALPLLGSTRHRWISPMVLTSTDPRVVQVAATHQQQTARRSDLAFRKRQLESSLAEALQWNALEMAFQASYQAAVKADLQGQRSLLRRLEALLAETSTSSQAGTSSERTDLETKASAVRARIRLLEAVTSDAQGQRRYDVLALRREYDRSRQSTEKSGAMIDSLTKAVAENDELLKSADALLAAVEASPYYLAIGGEATLAFVPYENEREVHPGDPVVACRVWGGLCRRVGTVGEQLAATEVRGTNPEGGQELRGKLVRLTLEDPSAAEKNVLYTKGGD